MERIDSPTEALPGRVMGDRCEHRGAAASTAPKGLPPVLESLLENWRRQRGKERDRERQKRERWAVEPPVMLPAAVGSTDCVSQTETADVVIWSSV